MWAGDLFLTYVCVFLVACTVLASLRIAIAPRLAAVVIVMTALAIQRWLWLPASNLPSISLLGLLTLAGVAAFGTGFWFPTLGGITASALTLLGSATWPLNWNAAAQQLALVDLSAAGLAIAAWLAVESPSEASVLKNGEKRSPHAPLPHVSRITVRAGLMGTAMCLAVGWDLYQAQDAEGVGELLSFWIAVAQGTAAVVVWRVISNAASRFHDWKRRLGLMIAALMASGGLLLVPVIREVATRFPA